MRQDHRFRRKGRLDDDQRRMLPVILIPLVVIVLMIIIVFADRSGEKDKDPGKEPSSSAAETMEPGSGEATEASGEAGDPGTDISVEAETGAQLFQSEEVPGIQDLLVRYYRARAAADAETLQDVYGMADMPASRLAGWKARLGNNAKYISGISNVATYVVSGGEAGSWLVYSTADIKFYTAKTPAPMIMWCYVKQDGEGSYRIMDHAALTSAELQFADQTNRSREVRALASTVNNQLKEALASDEALREVYGVLHEGSPVWSDETETKDQVVILDGAGQDEPAEDGAAADAGESGSGTGESAPGASEPGSGTGESAPGAGEPGSGTGESAPGAGEPGSAGGEPAGQSVSEAGETASQDQ